MKQKQVTRRVHSFINADRKSRRLKKTARKRISKGKLFRKGCFGCQVQTNWETTRDRICYMPYKSMPKCPCVKCLVKVACTAYCDLFHEARLKSDGRIK